VSHQCRSERICALPEHVLIFVHTEEVTGSIPVSPTGVYADQSPYPDGDMASDGVLRAASPKICADLWHLAQGEAALLDGQARVQDDGRRANVTDRHGTPARPRKLHAHSGFAVVVAWTEAREESSHCRPPHQP